MNIKESTFKVLNGMSLGIVAALIPSALLGEICKGLGLDTILTLTQIASSMLPIAVGIGVAYQFKLNPLESICLSIASIIGAGTVQIVNGALVLKGTGDVINCGITVAIALVLINLLRGKAQTFTILILPIVVSIVAGYIGLLILPYVSGLTKLIGVGIAQITQMQPILMGALIASIFSVLIISPFSTVGVALAVGLSGIASGTANLGICATSFGLAIAGYKVNGLGLSLAPILGSPKIQMANFIKNPKMILPIVANAFCLGILGAIFNIKGTPFSAGFGISGLIGPINALNQSSWSMINILLMVVIFVVAPIVLAYIFKFVFIDKLNIISEDDYKLNI